MTTFQHRFAVLDAHGRFVALEDDPNTTGRRAEQVAGGKAAALWLATALPENVRPNATDPRAMPQMAWRASSIGKIDLSSALRLSARDVVTALNEVRAHEGQRPLTVREVSRYYQSFVGTNAKTGKVVFHTTHGRDEVLAGCRGVSLAPARIAFEEARPNWREQRQIQVLDDARRNTFCLASVKECRAACLIGSGQNALSSGPHDVGRPPRDTVNYRAKIMRSLLLRQAPEAFLNLVAKGFESWRKAARTRGVRPFGRLNVLSDLPWELICPDFFEHFHDISFYDYTKVPGRLLSADAPRNYHLTFSWSTPRQLQWLAFELTHGRNVAVPFFHPDNRAAGSHFTHGRSVLPKSFLGVPVISGDEHDLRPLDAYHPAAQDGPVVVGLRFKEPIALDVVGGGSRSRAEFGAFVVDVYETQDDAGNTIYVGSQVPAYTRLGRTWIREQPLDALAAARGSFEEAVHGARQRWSNK